MLAKFGFVAYLCFHVLLYGQNYLTTDQLLSAALENNLQLKADRQNLKIATAKKIAGISPDNPVIFIEKGEIHDGVSNDQAVGISQTIEFPTVYLHRNHYFNSNLKMIEQEIELQNGELLLEVYFKSMEFIFLEKQSEFLEENSSLLRNVYEQNLKRFQVGDIDKLEVLKSKVQFRQISTNVSNLNLEKAKVLRELQVMVNLPDPIIPQMDITIDTSLVYADSRRAFVNSHPRLLLKSFEIQKMKYEKSLAYATYLPDLEILLKDQKVDGRNLWGFEVGLSLPLWLGKQIGSVKMAKYSLKKSEMEKQSVENEIRVEFESYWNEYQQAKNNFLLYQHHLLPESEEIFTSAEKSYQEGEIAYLDFADSYRIKLETETAYLQAVQNLGYAAAKLNKFRLIDYLKSRHSGE